MSYKDEDLFPSEDTKVTPAEIQEELIKDIEYDTDPEFKKSEFWFRFQELEREVQHLKEGYEVIYKVMKMRWDKLDQIPNQYLKIIFEIVQGVAEGPSMDYEINITT